MANQTVHLTPQRNECDEVNDSGQPEKQPAGKKAGGTLTREDGANLRERADDLMHRWEAAAAALRRIRRHAESDPRDAGATLFF